MFGVRRAPTAKAYNPTKFWRSLVKTQPFEQSNRGADTQLARKH